MKEIINSQREYFNSGATRSIDFRKKQLRKLKKVLKEHEAEFQEAIYEDFRKSNFECYATELALIYQSIDDALQNIDKWTRRKRAKTNLVNFPASSYVVPEPLGVALVIGAWNYPFMLSIAPIVPAIAAGNTVILKPSELPARTSQVMAKLISAHFDPNFLMVVEGGVPETTALLEQRFDTIFFTGSVPVGRIVYEAAAKHLTPVTLELGGKSPAIVSPSCSLKMTLKRLVWSKFLNAGQTCISPDYVLVHTSIAAAFLEGLYKEIEANQYKIENGNYVQIINEKNYDRLVSLIDLEKVRYGGHRDREQRYIEPTVLTEVTLDDPVMKDEIFGPILPVLTYESLDEVIAMVNRMEKPLACYLFSSNKHEKKRVLNEISFGAGCINDAVMHITNPYLPYGGVGESGMGSYHGQDGFKAFSHYKGYMDKPTWFELNLKYFPYTKGKLGWIKKIMRF